MWWRARMAASALVGALFGCAPAVTPTTEVSTTSLPPANRDVVSADDLPLEVVPPPEGLFASAYIPPLSDVERKVRLLAGSRAADAFQPGSHWLSHVIALVDRSSGSDCASSVSWCKKRGKPEINTACALPIADYARAKRELARTYRGFRRERGIHRYFIPKQVGEPGSMANPEDRAPPEPVPEDERDGIPWNHVACDLVHASGPAPARLACAEHNQSLERLRGWLAQGAPLQSAPRDRARLEIGVTELHRQYASFIRNESREGLKELQRILVTELHFRGPDALRIPASVLEQAFQFWSEATRFEAEVELNDRGAHLTAELELSAAKSWPGQVIQHQIRHAGPAPEMFWRLPLNSIAAGFWHGLDEEFTRPLSDGLAVLVRAFWWATRFDRSTRRATEAFLAKQPRSDVPWVWATGLDDSIKGVEGGDSSYVRTLETFVSGYGWSIWGLEVPQADIVAWVDSARQLTEELARESHSNRAWFSVWRVAPKLRRKRGLRGFPRGTVVFDLVFPTNQEMYQSLAQVVGNVSYLTPPTTTSKRRILRVAILPQGASRTWVGLAFNHGLLRRQLRAVVSADAASQLQAAREKLNALSSEKHVMAGFTSAHDLTRPSLSLSTYRYPREMESWHALVSAAPRHASTPIVYALDGRTSETPKLRFDATLTRPALVEALVLLPSLMPGSDAPVLLGPGGYAAP